VIRAVIDTNVLVSAMISPSGNEALLLLAVRQGFVKPCFSDEILEEYSGVLARRRFGFAADSLRKAMQSK
jgi:putative PIN family toxin of toxin-antitoxin system